MFKHTLTVALVMGGLAFSGVLPSVHAGEAAKNPCSVMNPCAAKKDDMAKNPCAAKEDGTAKNPCATKKDGMGMNPCAPKK